VSYFNLRKRGPEDEPDEAVDEETATEETAEDDEEDDEPVGLVGAVWAGISGPGKWLTARGHPGAAWTLYAGSAWAAGYYGGWAAVGVIAAWIAAALLFMPRDAKDRVTAWFEHRDRAPAAPPADAPPGGGRDGILRLLYDLIGEARGVHLSTVLAHLQQHGQWEGKEVADLRQHLQALGIPVEPKLKIGKTPTRGVTKAALDALPPLRETSPSPTPSPPV
jgi:hypothetical protein